MRDQIDPDLRSHEIHETEELVGEVSLSPEGGFSLIRLVS